MGGMKPDDWMEHLNHLELVLQDDHDEVLRKEHTYKGSWKQRGGVGAFMMAARKWDRLENILAGSPWNYDVLKAMTDFPDGEDGTVLAEVRDLRRYLLLFECEMIAMMEATDKLLGTTVGDVTVTRTEGVIEPIADDPPEADDEWRRESTTAIRATTESVRMVPRNLQRDEDLPI